MTRLVSALLFAGAVLVAASSASISPAPAHDPPTAWPVHVPICPEDAVAVGHGDYVAGFGWDSYQCIALDDLTGE
jgi:hypothetical protein